MLERLDGVILATTEPAAAAERFEAIFGTVAEAPFTSDALGCDVLPLRCGTNVIRLATPTSDGPVQQHLDTWGPGLCAAVFSTKDVGAVAARLKERDISFTEEGGGLHIDPTATFGLRTEIVAFSERERVGVISFLYEVTHLVRDWKAAQDFWTDTFGLDDARFSPIRSEQYGYEGMLTLFDPPDRLDRIEVITPYGTKKTMGRFHVKRGDGPYMFYTECHDMAELKKRLDAAAAPYTPTDGGDVPQGLFVHPPAANGVLIGVGRPNLAWSWSGRPELAKR